MEETYQDGTCEGLVVDKERGVFRIHMHVLTIGKRNLCAPTIMVVGGWGRRGKRGEPVGGVMWLWSWLVGWLACTEGLEMPEEGGPICTEAGTFQGLCVGGPVPR